MSLSTRQQLKIIGNRGDFSPDETNIQDLILQGAIIAALAFMPLAKDPGQDPLAIRYRQKLENLNTPLLREDVQTFNSLTRIWVVILGATNVTKEDIISANDNQWYVYVEDHIFAAMEFLAAISHEEKTAYDAI
tara:strand:+ start:18953 stop:19354 length:402 start_codon:yes stop_codon:yes gene_type:complete